MKIIYNKIIPFKGYLAINLFTILFVRSDTKKALTLVDFNHESIHSEQMKELAFVFFYLWYFIEWVVKIFKYGSTKKAYRNISFEVEAYSNENDFEYLKRRKHYCWAKFI